MGYLFSFPYFSAFQRHDVDIASSVGYFILQVHYCTFTYEILQKIYDYYWCYDCLFGFF